MSTKKANPSRTPSRLAGKVGAPGGRAGMVDPATPKHTSTPRKPEVPSQVGHCPGRPFYPFYLILPFSSSKQMSSLFPLPRHS